MALIKCPECGREVSDQAKACPSCGYPFDKLQNKNGFPAYTIIAFLLLVFFGVSMIFFHIGWVMNSILLIATFIFSIVALMSKKKLCILSAIPLIISGIAIAMLLLGALIQ